MTLDDRIAQVLAESAEAHGAPPSELESIIVRGRRRRFFARFFTFFGSGTALLIALVVTISFTQATGEPDIIAGEQTDAAPIDTTATATEISVVGHISEDSAGYTFIPEGGGDVLRFLQAHTSQVEGDALFGPAISDGNGGFIYTVSDVVEGSETRQGWVLWVPPGAAEPIVIADEPVAGVGQILGVVGAGPHFAVYTTVAGRTVQLRRVQISHGGGDARTLVEDFAAGDAAADRIIELGTREGCGTLRVLDDNGGEVAFAGLPTGACPALDQATLSPDGTSVAYLDRTNDKNLLVVVDLASGATRGRVPLDSRKRIVAFDGDIVTLTGDTAIDVASGSELESFGRIDTFQVRLNSLLVLQVPGTGDTLSHEEAQAAAASESEPPVSGVDTDVELLLDYLADEWTIAVRPDPEAAATAVDLDAFGVTLRGVGPYLLGADVQRLADESGHVLLSLEPSRGCRTMRISPLHGVTEGDVQLVVNGDRLVGMEFSSNRFSFDGVTVGSALTDAARRLSDASVTDLGGATVLVLDIDAESTAQFRATGGTITSFSVTEPESCTS